MNTEQLTFIELYSDFIRKFSIVPDIADFIACQFALESAFGTSPLAKVHNNLCGMKLPKFRITTAMNFGSSDKWAKYSSVSDCVFDYFLCLTYRQPLRSQLEYLDMFKKFLSGWYCPEKSYINKIDNLYVKFKTLKDGKH